MDRALIIGGTRFIGRHLIAELLAHNYSVATFTRGRQEHPFEDDDRVEMLTGDRADTDALIEARNRYEPEIVVDMIGYYPAEVRAALEVFEDQRYVFVSSASAYGAPDVPFREDETQLHACSRDQAVSDDPASYGPRKAECDRAVFTAATEGVDARSIRPVLVYGPHDHTERYAYWTHRAVAYDRVLVPGDGDSLLGRVYVEDVASGIRIVAERGEPGEAYNVADRNAMTLRRSIELAAAALDHEVEVIGASERELAVGGLTPDDFVLYTARPMLADTTKLAALGWTSTPLDESVPHTVLAHEEAGRHGAEHDPGRAAEEAVLDAIGG